MAIRSLRERLYARTLVRLNLSQRHINDLARVTGISRRALYRLAQGQRAKFTLSMRTMLEDLLPSECLQLLPPLDQPASGTLESFILSQEHHWRQRRKKS
jgi:transcriptional regulator with XRE-family HTH domain